MTNRYIVPSRPAIALALLFLATVATAQVQSVQRPLTMPGKQALYQRVIAVPGASLSQVPAAAAPAQAVTPFAVFYIYERRSDAGEEWLQVGTDSTGVRDGWLRATQAIEWKQTLTVGFRDPANHPRVLLFRDRDSLKTLLDSQDAAAFTALRQRAEQRDTEGSPVAAIQPDGFIDIRRNFYLVPILNHEDVLVGPYQGRLLEVASVPLRDPTALGAYSAGIVFVIDSTVSMGPYIERTRATMRRVYAAIEEAGLAEKVSYGLVAFRDNTGAVPELAFASRLYADLADGIRGNDFLDRMREVRPAAVSSSGFNEDAYAGVAQAIRDIDWTGYYARYVILITDAGPRVGTDPLSTTGLGADALRELAREKDIAIWAMHLRTPEGASNHAYAEAQYRRLSSISGIGEFYYPVPTGSVDAFERALSAMTAQLTSQVQDAALGRPPPQIPEQSADANGELAAFQSKVAKLGYALRLRYVEEGAGQAVPALFNAWLVDRDIEQPAERAIDVRVLLTRAQLSDLHDVLRRVLVTAEEGTLAPESFLDELKSLAVTISRDPQAAKGSTRASGGESLADLGYMREYLDGLPYTSEVMNLDLATWQQWSAQRQFEFINKLDGKVAYYRSLHDNVDLWVSLDGGPVDGDSLYPLLLEALP